MKTIESYNGGEIIVDDKDFETLSEFRWFYRHKGSVASPAKIVFRRSQKTSSYITMARHIMGCGMESHIIFLDDNGLNHQRNNLRVVTLAELRRRVPPREDRKYKGISFIKSANKYTVAITLWGIAVRLGYVLTEEEAAQRYDAALRFMRFTYAYYNFPGEKFELPKHLEKKLRRYKNENPKVRL